MIELNLLPEELRKKEIPRFVLPEIPIRKTLTVFLSVFFGAQILVSLFALYEKLDLERIKREVASLKVSGYETSAQKSETVQMRARLKEVDVLTARPFYWSSLLNGVSDSMIKGVWLTGLSVTDVAQAGGAANTEKSTAEPNAKNRTSVPARALKLEGSVVGRGDETAYIGKFIEKIKSNPQLADLFSDTDLSDMNQKKIKEFDVYDFVLINVFKREKAGSA